LRSDKNSLKICDRVYIVGGPEISHGQDCCVYLVDGGGVLALIDSGCGPGYKAILANILRLGFEPEHLRSMLLTHCHIDHVGSASLFQAEYGVELIAHSRDAAPLEAGDRLMTAAFLYGVRLEPMVLDRKLESDHDQIQVGDITLEVLLAPGHTPGSVVAYADINNTRVLFGQDIHGPFHPDFGSDIAEWRRSMDRLLSLDADILCEGHFGVYSPAGAVRSYIESYLERFGAQEVD
jgi:glyoxylase-like metal-dependent hydrolase (beta-lactamase superfamily II)